MNDLLLRLENISYKLDEKDILSDISLNICRGDNIVFFGPEHSGLYNLFEIIMGFIDDYEGDVFFNNKSVKHFNYHMKLNYRKELGYLHSDYGLIANLSVKQNISLPLEYHTKLSMEEIESIVDSMIDELGLGICKNSRPVSLTNSEILKTAFGRAVVLDPDILLVEHAFEGQSPLNILTLISTLKKRIASGDKSVLFITYEPEKFVDFIDRFIMFFNGRIVFSGDRDQFLYSDNGYLNQYKKMERYGPMSIL